ncbi:Interleukin-1 Receptor-Associated Kinase 1 [Manis pentadactyla]|nr:Interleukin-1 Receptor-Associated Kinase 1 [Manis pentadactyla]
MFEQISVNVLLTSALGMGKSVWGPADEDSSPEGRVTKHRHPRVLKIQMYLDSGDGYCKPYDFLDDGGWQDLLLKYFSHAHHSRDCRKMSTGLGVRDNLVVKIGEDFISYLLDCRATTVVPGTPYGLNELFFNEEKE